MYGRRRTGEVYALYTTVAPVRAPGTSQYREWKERSECILQHGVYQVDCPARYNLDVSYASVLMPRLLFSRR